MKYTKKNSSKEVKHSGNTKHSKSSDMQASSKSNEDEANAIKRTPDEEIKACFEAAKQKLDGLLKSRKQVIQDLACELELLGRRREDIAAEIVHELRNCEELSRSQIYSYLDDKYKNQTQAQRRKGKKVSNPDPKTGTESSLEQTITVGNNGRQTISNEHDISSDLSETPDKIIRIEDATGRHVKSGLGEFSENQKLEAQKETYGVVSPSQFNPCGNRGSN